MKVYHIQAIWVKRDSVLFEPQAQAVTAELAGIWQEEIHQFVLDYFHGKTTIFGITREFAELYMLRVFIKYKFVTGFSGGVAVSAAKANFVKFMATRASSLGWVAVGIFAAAVVFGVVFAIADWLEKDTGAMQLPYGSCFLRYNEKLWWGGLVGHPAPKVWDFTKCEPLGPVPFYDSNTTGKGYGHWDDWDFLDGYEFKVKRLIGWYVYRFSAARVTFLGVAHNMGFDRYRLTLPEWAHEAFDWPVGQGIREFYACKYLADFSDYFR